MTYHDGDRQYYLTREIQGFWENGLSPEVKPRVTGNFFQTPPPPNPEGRIVSLSPEGLVIICVIIPPSW